jgi:microcompartment protein CcmL/EutN
MMQPALALLELSSVAVGIEVGDAMVKRSPVDVLYAGTIHPGHYLVLVAGAVADVEEALDAADPLPGESLLDRIFLPDVHDDVVAALGGRRAPTRGEALGVIETTTVASVVVAADAGVKGAAVTLRELRLGDGLGGKGYVLFGGPVAEVEAAVELGTARVDPSRRVGSRVIARLHDEMEANLAAAPRFRTRVER